MLDPYTLRIDRGSISPGARVASLSMADRGDRVYSPARRRKVLHFLAHRGDIQHPIDRARLGKVKSAGARPPNHPQHPARPQRHLDIRTDETTAGRSLVIQGPVQWLGGQNRDQFALIRWDLLSRPTPEPRQNGVCAGSGD